MREQTLGEELIEGLGELLSVLRRGDKLSDHFLVRVVRKPENKRNERCEE